MTGGKRIVIHYCTQCQWMLRAAWLAQEILSTFGDELEEVALRPGSGGIFEIRVGDECVWERQRDGGFPGAKEIKLKIRDQLCPEKPLGKHIDRALQEQPSQDPPPAKAPR